MSFAGNLKTVSFGDVLQLISTGRRTGALHLDRPQRGKKIFFREGDIIAAASEPPTDEERLGQLLLRQGQISPDDLEKALKRQRAGGKMLGQILVDRGLLGRDALTTVLRSQVEEVVYSIFGWPDGEFGFAEGEQPSKSQMLVELNTLNVMMEGARRYDEYAQIAGSLPDDNMVLRISPAPKIPKGEIVLTAEDIDILAAIDGERSVGQIICEGSHGEFASAKSLHKLLSNEIAEPSQQKADAVRRRDEEKDTYELVYKLYSRSLESIHKALVEHFGDAGERLFFKVPDACKDDPWGLPGALTETPGPDAQKAFREKLENIPEPVRLHRALGTACQTLAVAVRSLSDRVGPQATDVVITGIQKELSVILMQRRALAEKYDIRREFVQALKGKTL